MFKTPNIQISESGIDLIANYSVYKHIDYTDVDRLEIGKGHLVKNWLLAFCIGLVVSVASVAWATSVVGDPYFGESFGKSRTGLLSVFSAIFLFSVGILIVFQALKKCKTLVITAKNKNYQIPLYELEKANEIDDLRTYLKSKVRLLRLQ